MSAEGGALEGGPRERTGEGHARPGAWLRRSPVPLLLVLIGGTCLSLVTLVFPFYEPRGDASLYILTAQSLLDGSGYSYMGEPFIVRPPGFPFLLVPVLATVGKSFLAMNLFVSLFGVAAVAFLFLYMRERLGDGLALVLSIVVWMSPALRVLSNQVLSDVPGLALLLGILLLDRWARAGPITTRDSTLGLCLGLVCYVRSALQFLIPAILLARAFEWRRLPPEERAKSGFSLPRVALLAVLPFTILTPWNLWVAAQDPPAPAEEVKVHSYSTAMWHSDLGDPASPELTWGQLAKRVPKRAARVLPVLATRMRSEAPTRVDQLLAWGGFASWLIILWRRREAPEIYAGGFLCILLVYFGFAQRLVLPIFAIVLSNVAEVGLLATSRVLSLGRARALVAFLLLVLAVHDFEARPNWQMHIARHRGYVKLAEYLDAEFREDATLAAFNGRHHQVYSGRPVLTLKWAFFRDGIDRVEEIIAQNGVEGVILPRGRKLSPHFEVHHTRVHRLEEFEVFRIRAAATTDE